MHILKIDISINVDYENRLDFSELVISPAEKSPLKKPAEIKSKEMKRYII